METAEIRRRWLSYFESKGHSVVPSAPLIYDDPNLLFVNAGMVPFKPYFLGQQSPPWDRATSVQKCVRTGDIEEVGKTSRHGTFFQMNGNFSFGDYFKAGAIEMAWELLTTPQGQGGYGIEADKLWATVFEDDDEAADLWVQLTDIPKERIVRRGVADNYWHMGVPGPGGPCSEIYVDRGPDYGPEGGPAVDEDRYMEIWNLVFMQSSLGEVRTKVDFDIAGDLPKKNIDTGMGLERIASILQGVDNMYEIDEVYPVLERAAEMTGKRYGTQSGHDAAHSHPDDVRLRVVADHIRSSLMLIGDGVTPGNEGRGYVLRRMLRRAVRSMRLLGFDEPSLPHLLPVSMERMRNSYPELEDGFDRISQIAYAEEEAFRRTLASGTTILDTAVAKTKAAGGAALAGAEAFQLHDTYGFPIDLTLEMAAEQGLEVDRDGFRALMQEQRDRAKADAKAKKAGHANTEVWRQFRESGATDFRAYVELDQRGQHRRPGARRRAGRGARAGAARPGRPRPHAVLCRVRRAGRRRGHHHRRRRAPEGHRRPAPGQGSGRAHRRGPARSRARGRGGHRRGRRGVADLAHARRTRAPTSCTRRCARCSAPRPCSPVPTTSPATSGSTSRGTRRSPRRPAARSRRSPTSRCARTSRSRRSTCACRRPASGARSRCSARPTTSRCGSSRSVARGRASCAAAPTCSTPRRSARSPSPVSPRWAPACAGWRPSSA